MSELQYGSHFVTPEGWCQTLKHSFAICENNVGVINARENRRTNQEWTIQKHCQHWLHKTPDEDKQNKKTQHKNNISLSQIVSQEKHNYECYTINPTNIRKVWRCQRGYQKRNSKKGRQYNGLK